MQDLHNPSNDIGRAAHPRSLRLGDAERIGNDLP
jgi:hypothetical protein